MWQKKRNEVKGKSYHYSTINRLQKEKKIDEVFLSRINQLTLEQRQAHGSIEFQEVDPGKLQRSVDNQVDS